MVQGINSPPLKKLLDNHSTAFNFYFFIARPFLPPAITSIQKVLKVPGLSVSLNNFTILNCLTAGCENGVSRKEDRPPFSFEYFTLKPGPCKKNKSRTRKGYSPLQPGLLNHSH
jgi:hypothetical protein